MYSVSYDTAGGLRITRRLQFAAVGTFDEVVRGIDTGPGMVLQSTYSYPARYSEHAVGFVDPPVVLRGSGRSFTVDALNTRGVPIVHAIGKALAADRQLGLSDVRAGHLTGSVVFDDRPTSEEYRSKKPTIMRIIRAIVDLFRSDRDDILGLYGAVGYDVVSQFENVRAGTTNLVEGCDLVMYLPDRLIRVTGGVELEYHYEIGDSSAFACSSDAPAVPTPRPVPPDVETIDERASFVAAVEEAHHSFARGDLFEVVISRSFTKPAPTPPSTIFRRLLESNPAPYGLLMNLGGEEHLVSASPEMFVRVCGRRVESCPIAGTAPRGASALEDERNIYALLSSAKDASELVMCTDVDRNDKSRICQPGTVRVLAYRQIEMYSRVIHTVAHIEGMLRPDFDSLDAFLTHMWAVTVTGAPKIAALSFIVEHERGRRGWYAGSFGKFLFNGDLDTAVTLRTIHLVDGVARVRAGSTLLFASEPESEADEAEWKAAALLRAIEGAEGPAITRARARSIRDNRVLLLDHEDSFVNTLADYFRQAGAEVTTLRVPRARPWTIPDFADLDLVCLSPGPGAPAEFRLDQSIRAAVAHGIPLFGVCLGLQGIVEYFGGQLGVLDLPAHGRESEVRPLVSPLFHGIDLPFRAGRYHSLYARVDTLPPELCVTAMSDDRVVMAVEHASLPIWAVQFHPESIMTANGEVGLRLIHNVLSMASGAQLARRTRHLEPAR